MPEAAAIREDTMIYRLPTDDSDDMQIQDVWGRKLEVKVVDASEVEGYVAAGWVTHPLQIPETEEKAKEVAPPPPNKELEEAKGRAADMQGKLEKALEVNARLTADLAAAQELLAGETKAKDEALEQLREITAKATEKPKLSIKDKP